VLETAVQIIVVDEGSSSTTDTLGIPLDSKGGVSLGTFIRDGNTILTHGHFTDKPEDQEAWENRDYFWFIDHKGNQTKLMRDEVEVDVARAETWLFGLPYTLGTPAKLGNPDTLSPFEDWLDIVYNAGSYGPNANLQVMSAVFGYYQDVGDTPTAVIWNTVLDPGDSGGGVFNNGLLVGNVWAREGLEPTPTPELSLPEPGGGWDYTGGYSGLSPWAYLALLPDDLR